MYKSPIQTIIDSENGLKTLTRVFANFYLNRYPFQVTETDSVAGDPDPNGLSYGIEDIMSVENISKTYRFGHGNSYTILGAGGPNPGINNYRVPGRVPQSRLYIAGQEVAYKYYISTVASSNSPSSEGRGFLASRGQFLGVPQVEYFDQFGNNKPLPGNSIVMKWNSVTCIPTFYKVYIKSRDIDTTGELSWNLIYDSHAQGQPPIRTGERYGATHITNSDAISTRIQLSKFDESLPSVPSDISGRTWGRRREWSDGDYLDFGIGESVSIMNVDNGINGVSKITAVDKSAGWIEVYGNNIIDKAINDANYSVEVFAINAGELTLYNQGDSWSNIENRWSENNNNLVDIAGAKVEVYGVSQRASRVEMIELSPCLAADLSKFVKSVEIVEELSDRAVNIPIGTVSANNGSIELSNNTMLFDKTNTRRQIAADVWEGSYFSEMLDDGVEFKCFYEVSSLQQSISDVIPICPMVSDSWQPGSMYGPVTVNLLDYTKFLQDRPAPDLVLHNYPVSSIIYMILDKCGFSRCLYWPENNFSSDLEPIVEYFWCQKEDNVWDVLQALATCTQTALFFDKFGYLRILPLPILTDKDRGEVGKNVWNLRGVSTQDGLSNIFTFSREISVPANHVSIKYHPVNIHGQAGVVARDTFWLPGDNYALGVAQLTNGVNPESETIQTISDGNAPPFPRMASFVNLGNIIYILSISKSEPVLVVIPVYATIVSPLPSGRIPTILSASLDAKP